MSESPAVTRRQLREYLIPAAGNSPYGNAFPRSDVFRFVLNPRNRRLLMFAGSALALVGTRMVGSNGLTMLADIARSFTRRK